MIMKDLLLHGLKWLLKEDWETFSLLRASVIPLVGHNSTQSLVLSLKNIRKKNHVFTNSTKL